ncbi:hypothetical protein [uncultured Bilophila sp.]|uniref:hypothetical protein n=1 Tax=uncultured Bilophila sp. TaxID=529385 RepID=UPI00280B20CD|nr:hypothetical protein [uncultured Bilophila sp.]
MSTHSSHFLDFFLNEKKEPVFSTSKETTSFLSASHRFPYSPSATVGERGITQWGSYRFSASKTPYILPASSGLLLNMQNNMP